MSICLGTVIPTLGRTHAIPGIQLGSLGQQNLMGFPFL